MAMSPTLTWVLSSVWFNNFDHKSRWIVIFCQFYSPSSAGQKTVSFYRSNLRDLAADFRHYIADFTGALGQSQAEVNDQLDGGWLGGRDYAQAQLGGDPGTADRDDHVRTFDSGDLLD